MLLLPDSASSRPAPAPVADRGFPWGSEGGVALVSTLAILSLLTVMLVAFTSAVVSDRKSTFNYSHGMAASEIARSGLDAIVSQLQSEIANTANAAQVRLVTNSAVGASAAFPVYRPLTNAALGPQRMSGLPKNADLLGIVKASLSGAAFYSGATAGKASSVATTMPSLNGRSVGIGVWDQPQLVPPGATNAFPVPDWIFVGREGPVIPSGGNLASVPSNKDAVFGRYAYVVYDTSGLLDINVAGYPKSVSAAAGNKGLLPWADLTQLTNTLSQSDVDALVSWRNQQHLADYAGYVTNAWLTNGFMRVGAQDTAFLGRQELIQFTKQPVGKKWAAALPYLTTFSRELNGPVWGPSADAPAGAPYDYASHQYGATTASRSVSYSYGPPSSPLAGSTVVPESNVFILNPRIQSAYTNAFGLVRKAGEPLVKYRFPLSKLALLEKQTESHALSATERSDILKYFGLVPAADSLGLFRHWIYTNPAGGGTAASAILTLDQVAALKRDPDFFELLQAGILSGSLGRGARGDYPSYQAPAGYPDPDLSLAYQIIRIGANVADQWDADSCPTMITFDKYNFYGVEDLPYISKMFLKAYSTATITATTGTVTPLVYFELWNPNQPPPAGAGANRPVNFRFSPYPGDYLTAVFTYITGSTSSYWQVGSKILLNSAAAPNKGVINFSAASADYREPALIYSSTAPAATLPTSLVNNANTGAGRDRGVAVGGLRFADVSLPAAGTGSSGYGGATGTLWPPWPASPAPWHLVWNFEFNMQLVYPLQYEWPVGSGSYHTYSTLAGLEMASPDGVPRWGLNSGIWTWVTGATDANSYTFTKGDPRSGRWAESSTYFMTNTVPAVPLCAGNSLNPSGASGTAAYAYSQPNNNLPFGTAAVASPYDPTKTYRFDLWAVNTNTVAFAPAPTPFYADADGTQRIGDSGYAGLSHLPFYAGDNTARPVILNHAFTSVADLGNVYRDMPWKSLNFFSPDSADAALLDLFTLSEGAVVAGRVNPNAAPEPVLRSLLAGANLDAAAVPATAPNASIPSANVAALASGLRGVATNSGGGFFSRADLVTKFMGNAAVGGVSAANAKPQREAVVRALAESSNTRTWNLLVDVIAQAGRYPDGATDPAQFVVEGQHRYWLHLAIDRYTGEIVDRQLEVVDE